MKKILCFLFVALGSYTVQAQGFKAGPKVGGNISKAWNEQHDLGKGDFGGQLGGLLNGTLDKKGRHAIQVEALYSMKTLRHGIIKLSTSYIDLPVLYQYNFIPSRKRGQAYSLQPAGNFYVTAGSQLSVLMSSKASYPNSEGAPQDVKSWTRPFDMSAMAGVGYKFTNGLSVETRYGLGLRHLHGAECALVPYGASLNTLQANIAYTLPVSFQTRK